MKLVFMGTPEIAATCLEGLIDAGLDVAAVVTRPDVPVGRNYVLTPPPVKVTAGAHGIPVLQPTTLDAAFLSSLEEIAPDLIVVVAYGKILPKALLTLPPLGCINLHVSLLPRWRGAAPMQRAVMAGDRETGVTVMYMDEGLDTGDILITRSFPIADCDTFGTVHDTSARIGREILPLAVRMLADGTAPRVKQPDTGVTYAAKIEKSECEIDYTLPAREVFSRMRGLTPIPLPVTRLPDGRALKVTSSVMGKGSGNAGEILALDMTGTGGITVACAEGAVTFTEVRPEGKPTMTAAAFLRGARLSVGDKLGR